ncbi:Eco47II family restriction endonuclease [Weissella paramesenteroides]|uniref:Eco47II family restriction endonuclease n=1 Tax=Weissella paramesenteroides TaxID=1249 RepID=UPI0021AEFC7A|nr:Eco47II family restriction endonuclease [Weissella paramesenteroides]MCT0485848.1 Eco47II family restriction endonuclease [Weissella paramesenteroides]
MQEQNKYVDFISDRDFLKAVKKVYEVYKSKANGFDIKKFYKNTIDPFRIYMDTIFQNISLDDYLKNEMNRKIEKSISNEIGSFQEELLGAIPGFKRYRVGDLEAEGVDIVSDDKLIWAEVKNKHNTVKGEDAKNIYRKLQNIAEKYPKSTVYYVRIIDTKSRNEQWQIPKHNLNHPRVKIISGDRFYELLTGDPFAFKKLLDAIPVALKDYVDSLDEKDRIANGSSMGLFSTIYTESTKNGITPLQQIVNDNFASYLGFGKGEPSKEDE